MSSPENGTCWIKICTRTTTLIESVVPQPIAYVRNVSRIMAAQKARRLMPRSSYITMTIHRVYARETTLFPAVIQVSFFVDWIPRSVTMHVEAANSMPRFSAVITAAMIPTEMRRAICMLTALRFVFIFSPSFLLCSILYYAAECFARYGDKK